MDALELLSRTGGLLRSGSLPAFAWPGGYTLVYLTSDNESLCAQCAGNDYMEWLYSIDSGTQWQYDPPVMVFVFYEGPDDYCANCNNAIESAYGDPDE